MRTLLLLVVGYLVYVSGTRLLAQHPLWRRAAVPVTTSSLARAPDPLRILRDVNRYRAQHGRQPLRYSPTCQAAARLQAQYNAAHGTFQHHNAELPTAGDRLTKANHHYLGGTPYWGENVLRYTLSRDPRHSAGWHVFDLYHHSPHHDAQMLATTPTRFGTASVVDVNGVLYNAEVFAN